MAELNRALGGEDLNSYSVSLDNQGRVTAHGFTGNVLPYAWFCPSGWYYGGGKLLSGTRNSNQMKAPSSPGIGY